MDKDNEYLSWKYELIEQHLQLVEYSKDLLCIQDNTNKITSSDLLLFSTMKNETFRLPYFLEYYRKLGVDHFIFVDNSSSDGMEDLLKSENDVSVYHSTKSYKDANFGMHWLNYLLKEYGTGHWCLTVDPDEFLIFPNMDTINLKSFTCKLDTINLKSFYAPLVDMYSDKSIETTIYEPGIDPLKVCPFFDNTGYAIEQYIPKYGVYTLRGGVRKRVFNQNNTSKSPALNKTPLIRWEEHFAYIHSTHVVLPRYLNIHDQKDLPIGALLHFKFIHQLKDKIETELHAKEHWNNSYEYKQYDKFLERKILLFDKQISERYNNWHILKRLDLRPQVHFNKNDVKISIDDSNTKELMSDINWYIQKMLSYEKETNQLKQNYKKQKKILVALQKAISCLVIVPFGKNPIKKYMTYKSLLKIYNQTKTEKL